MKISEALCLLVFFVMGGSLYSLPTIEVCIQQPDAFEEAFLSELESYIISEGDYTLVHSYRDSDLSVEVYDGITLKTGTPSAMGYTVFIKALPLQDTSTRQAAISLYHFIHGKLFYSEIVQTDLESPRIVAKAVYRDKLMHFHGLFMKKTAGVEYKQGLTSEMQQYAVEIVQYWRTPVSQGGAGEDIDNLTKANLNNRLGFPISGVQVSIHGTVEIFSIKGHLVKFMGIPGKTNSQDPDQHIFTTLDLEDCKIVTYVE